MKSRLIAWSVALGLGVFLPSPSSGDDRPEGERVSQASRDPLAETGLETDHLTGEWGGLRNRLVARGIHLQAGYVGEGVANISGGIKRGVVAEGLGKMALELDSEKLTGGFWHGARFRASSLWLHGTSPSRKLIGDALTASNIDAYDSIRLYELWIEQSVFDGHVSLRVGSLLADEEFTGTDYGSLFLNSGFGWPAFISGNVLNTGPAFFVSAPGVRLRIEPWENFYFQSGVYDGDSFDSPSGDPRVNANGLHWKLDDSQGAFFINELGFQHHQEKNTRGLPGVLKLGAWFHTGDFNDNLRDRTGHPFVLSRESARTHDFTFGAYLAAEQMVWRPDDKSPEQGLGVFFRIGGSPEDRSAFAMVVDAGFHYTGLIPGREHDRAGLGVVFAEVSDDIARQQRLDQRVNGTRYRAFSDYEHVFELTYDFEVTPWWRIQPDLQWIRHPGGSAALPDAFVIGLRASLTF